MRLKRCPPPPPPTDHAVYNGTVFFTNGDVRTYKRERPKLVQDAKGTIVALANGVGVELLDRFVPGNDSACTLVAHVGTPGPL